MQTEQPAEATRPGTPDDIQEMIGSGDGPETGKPSPQLERLRQAVQKSKQEGGSIIQADSEIPEYETLTKAQAEAGVFSLVGGYVDRDGQLHKEVEIEAMGGDEEDLMGNRKVPIVLRINSILSRVVKRLGTVTDRGEIARAVAEMPLGTRQHLLVATRVTSHWLTEGDLYKFAARCPRCRRESEYEVNLLTLRHYEPEDPSVQVYEAELPHSKSKVQWRVLPGEWDHALDLLGRHKEVASDFLTHAIAARVVSVDGEKVDLSTSDVLTPDKSRVKLSRRAQSVIKWAKRLKVVDRETLRARFLEGEPGIDTDIECECKHERCGAEWTVGLDLGQESFFFPQTTSTRSKMRFST